MSYNPKSDYISKIMRDLNIVGKPRFFYMKPNFTLKPHKDFALSVNILLSDESVPINIEELIITIHKHLSICKRTFSS